MFFLNITFNWSNLPYKEFTIIIFNKKYLNALFIYQNFQALMCLMMNMQIPEPLMDMLINIRHNCASQENSKKVFSE